MVEQMRTKVRARRWAKKLNAIMAMTDEVFSSAMKNPDEFEYFTDLIESVRESLENAINCADGMATEDEDDETEQGRQRQAASGTDAR